MPVTDISNEIDFVMSDSSQGDQRENEKDNQPSKSAGKMMQKQVPTLLRFKLKTAKKSAPLPSDVDDQFEGNDRSSDADKCETIALSPSELAASPMIPMDDSPADPTHAKATQPAGQSSDGFDSFGAWVRLKILRVLRNRLKFSHHCSTEPT